MELKRAAELCLCSLLTEALSDLLFLPSRGGGDDLTVDWQPTNLYRVGDVIRPTNHSLLQAVVVIVGGTSGSSEPAFDDVIGNTYGSAPTYQTISSLAVATEVDSGNPEPPFCVISIDEGEKTMATEETDYLQGTLVWVTRADNTNVVDHSTNFKRIYDALCNIGSGYDIMRRLMVHGVDVGKTDEFVDSKRQAHGDTISFTMGVSEKPAQG